MVLENIKTLCAANKISIAKLEKELGLGNATIRGWGNSSPNVDNLKKVADYFGLTLDALLADKPMVSQHKSNNTDSQ